MIKHTEKWNVLRKYKFNESLSSSSYMFDLDKMSMDNNIFWMFHIQKFVIPCHSSINLHNPNKKWGILRRKYTKSRYFWKYSRTTKYEKHEQLHWFIFLFSMIGRKYYYFFPAWGWSFFFKNPRQVMQVNLYALWMSVRVIYLFYLFKFNVYTCYMNFENTWKYCHENYL